MKKSLIVILSSISITLSAQTDSLSRVVTVERDYQPVIQSVGKINLTPTISQNELPESPVIYSTYSAPLSIGHNIQQLAVSEAIFTPRPILNGVLDAGIGYRNTHLLFGYQIREKKNMSLRLYANHDAYWGEDALSESQLGMQVTGHLSGADLYFGIEGNHDFFSYFGRYYTGQNKFPFASIDRWDLMYWQNLWNLNAHIGIRSTDKRPFQYRFQTGYTAFIASEYAIEHQVRSHIDLGWQNGYHAAGIHTMVLNRFYTSNNSQLITPTSLSHAIRVEPYYSWKSKQFKVHMGVNIDLNIGTGKMLSTIDNLSFAPSPNVKLEWSMMDNIFHIYANAKGHYGFGSLEEYLGYNRYLDIEKGLSFAQPRAYTPVDAQVGFRLRPAKTLLIDFYGGYAYQKDACMMYAVLASDNIAAWDYQLSLQDYQNWKAGASVHYHYRDIITLNVAGNYYFWQPGATQQMATQGRIYDRPDWDAQARLDIRFDSKWSIYSENYFAGSRWALTTAGDKQLKPIIALNVGAQFAINRWVMVYAQVNDYLNRKHDIFYGYQSQGLHCLIGAKWQF